MITFRPPSIALSPTACEQYAHAAASMRRGPRAWIWDQYGYGRIGEALHHAITMRWLRRFGDSARTERETVHGRVHELFGTLLTHLAEMTLIPGALPAQLDYYRHHFPIAKSLAGTSAYDRAYGHIVNGMAGFDRTYMERLTFTSPDDARQRLPNAIESLLTYIDARASAMGRELDTPAATVQNVYFHIACHAAGNAEHAIAFAAEWASGAIPFLPTAAAKAPFKHQADHLREFFALLTAATAFQGPERAAQFLGYIRGDDFDMQRPLRTVQHDLLHRCRYKA